VPEVRIAAEPRTEFGKGAARRTRRGGWVPAIVYGHGTDTRHITLPGHDLMMALKTPNVLIRIDGLAGGNQLTLPKAVQRNPIRGFIEHVDLIMVRRGEKVTVEVPVQVTGEVFSGGLLDQQMVQVAVEAEATNIPSAFEVDVEGMEIGAAVHAGELTLPAGVTLEVDPDALVLPKAVQRDPIRGSVEHVDLIMVRRGEKVTVDVQVQVTGEVFPGGLLDQQLVQVAVEAEATNIPGAFEVDVEGMEIGTAVQAGDLTLPAGVTLVTDPDALVLHVLAAPTAEQLEADLGEVPAAEEVPPSPEEAAAEAPAAPEAEAPAEQS